MATKTAAQKEPIMLPERTTKRIRELAVERERLQMQINEIVEVAMELLNVPASYRLTPLPDEKLAFMPMTQGESDGDS